MGYEWIEEYGRDEEGDRYHSWLMVENGKGRIWFEVEVPFQGNIYQVNWKVDLPGGVDQECRGCSCATFYGKDCALKYCEDRADEYIKRVNPEPKAEPAAPKRGILARLFRKA